jgi:oligoendopeptidase F
MGVWQFMYAHPDTTAAQLREATLEIARDVWNRYYAPVFRVKDVELLAVYSHMISNGLYLPDYPIGHIIAFQLDKQFHDHGFGAEFERVTRQGRLTPDAWMQGAVGGPLSAQVLLEEARAAMR